MNGKHVVYFNMKKCIGTKLCMQLKAQLQLLIFGLIGQQADCGNNTSNEVRNANSVS